MITYIAGGFFSSPAPTLVNTVNTVGVMGKGLAKTFHDIYPEMFAAYQERCHAGEIGPGTLQLWRTSHKWVLNVPTKRHWRAKARLDDVEAGLRTFAATYERHGIGRIAFPQLGCGNGGLVWEEQVRPLMERYLAPLPIPILIHVADDGPLMPEGEDGARLQAWLQGESALPDVAAFWSAMVAAAEKTESWTVEAGNQALRIAASVPVTGDHLFDLWRALRATGFATRDDLPLGLGIPDDALFDLLDQSTLLAPARVVSLPPTNGYDGPSTADLLADPAARAVRLLPALAPTVTAGIAPGAAAWPANTTTLPLQLSLTG